MEKRWLRHVWFWLAYMALEGYTEFKWLAIEYQFSVAQGLYAAFASEIAQIVMIKIPLVYILFCQLSLYNKHKLSKWQTIGAMTVVVLLFAFLSRVLVSELLLPNFYLRGDQNVFEFQGIINAFMDTIFIAGIALALKQNSISQQLRDRERTLVKEKLETELNFLKSQVNPHFLFNTLNNIYSLARKKSDQTAEVVVKLSKLLRFMLYETQQQSIPIHQEIQFLQDYIELEKIRYDERLVVRFDFHTDDDSIGIMPLILVPFVENAFKHGASETTQEVLIKIKLELLRGKLSFVVENSFEKDENVLSKGIGLKNLRRQLELRYPTFELHTAAEGTHFKAQLLLNLNETP